jgi:3-methyladenine DNA glycosylase Mpg
MNINDSLNSLDVTDPRSEIHIEFDKEITKKNVTTSERIGIGHAAKKKWRFVCGI